MRGPAHPPEVRAAALELLAKHGAGEASRRTGIPKGTIASWGHRAGVTAPPIEERRAIVAEQELHWQARKVQFGERLADLASKAADNLEERLDGRTIAGTRDLGAVIAVLVDKAQLLTGGATTREEVVQRTPEAEAELAQVLELVRSA